MDTVEAKIEWAQESAIDVGTEEGRELIESSIEYVYWAIKNIGPTTAIISQAKALLDVIGYKDSSTDLRICWIKAFVEKLNTSSKKGVTVFSRSGNFARREV